MNDNELAPLFKALGDPTRLRIFRLLRSCCGPIALEEDGGIRTVEGPTVGEVCCRITGAEKITSTISEHLKELRQAGLIVTEKRGKHVVCAVDPRVLKRLADFFERESSDGCC